MKHLLAAAFLFGLTAVPAGWAGATEKPELGQSGVCPVMGGPIDNAVSVDYRGAKLYFCCPECIGKFKADTAKYAAKANLQLVVTGQAQQTACPISGMKTDPKFVLKVGGVDVAFCCGMCPKKVAALKPAEQIEMVFGKGFEKGYTVKKD